MLYISTEKLFFKGVYIYGDTEVFSNTRDQFVTEGNSRRILLQILFKENIFKEKVLIKTLTVSICPKIT